MDKLELDLRARRRIGSVLSRTWRIETVLGSGETAVVYGAVTCSRKRQQVAIRILHRELSSDEHIREHFFRGGYLANRVAHPAAVPITSHACTEDGSAFLVMDLVQGETLEQHLQAGHRPSAGAALDLVEQLLDVLGQAHEHGIVHRNLCPRHLVLSRDGRLRVLDFGGARLREVIQGCGRSGSFPGAPGYAPPEQVRGRADPHDGRCDLYAIGALLYHLLCGRPAHDADTPMEQMARAIASPVPSIAALVPHLPREVPYLVDRALRYDAELRWADARSMQTALRRARERIAALGEHSPVVLGSRSTPVTARSALAAASGQTLGGSVSSA